MKTTWAQLQMYSYTYISLKPLSTITDMRAPHVMFFLLLSTSSSASTLAPQLVQRGAQAPPEGHRLHISRANRRPLLSAAPG